MLYTLGAGLSCGVKGSVLAAFSRTLDIVPHLAAVLLGFAALLHTSALLFSAVKYAGILYLLYMAWQCLNSKGILSVSEEREKRSGLRLVTNGILVNVLNPKLSIFFVAFLPQFIRPDDAAPLLISARTEDMTPISPMASSGFSGGRRSNREAWRTVMTMPLWVKAPRRFVCCL